MITEICANLFAGLGLFFIGIKFISENMKQMTGRSFRRFASLFSTNRYLAALAGLVSGALVQSTTAVTFIMASLVSSRMIPLRNSIPMVAWSNVGSTLIILLAVLNLRNTSLFLMGMIGVFYYLNLHKSDSFRSGIGALLGLGAILTGLTYIKAGSAPLKEIHDVTVVLNYIKDSHALPFLVSGLLTLVLQSSTTMSVIAIALARSGLLSVDQTMMVIYGANLGSGVSTWILSATLSGSARQLALYQSLFKVVGTVILVPLFYAEYYLHLPGVHSLLPFLSSDFGRQMAYVSLIFQLISTATTLTALNWVLSFLERISPITREEQLSLPQFIYEKALEEPETAVDLAEKEHQRLVSHLPSFLDAVREESAASPADNADTLHRSVSSVAGEVTQFVNSLMERQPSRECLERALNLQNRNDLLISLSDNLKTFVAVSTESKDSPQILSFSQRAAEALHLILTTAQETVETPDEDNRQILLQLTADRGEMMGQMRRSLNSIGQDLTAAQNQFLMSLTTLFERIIWLLQRLGTLLARPATA
jgi:phosphate:Na+ symporter